jgi:hypothetical protein
MILKLMNGQTTCMFEGHYIQVTKVNKTDLPMFEGAGWTYFCANENSEKFWVAHVNRLNGGDTLYFDCEAYVMENGKTVDHYRVL